MSVPQPPPGRSAGKSVSGARHFDLYEAAAAFSYAAGVCRDLHGDVRPTSYPPDLFPGGGPEIITMRMREPAGVVAELLPWNAPLMTGSQRVAAGLAAGCSFVVKPPEEAVVTTINLARLAGVGWTAAWRSQRRPGAGGDGW
jgi:acyl-CoA reductase-like NAD-dependent aldehyde dehydrogenase